MALHAGQKKEYVKDFFNKKRSHLAGLKEEIRLRKALDLLIKEAKIKEKKVKEKKFCHLSIQ